MALSFFGKKKAPAVSAVDRVRGLSDQGFSEPEVIRTMRREGYSPVDVDRAMKSAIHATASSDMSQPFGAMPRPGEPFRGGGARFEMDEPGFGPPAPQMKPLGDDFSLPELPGMAPSRSALPEPPAPPHRAPPSPLDMEIEPDFRHRPTQEIAKLRAPREEHAIERSEVEEIIEGLVEEKWDLVERELGEFTERMKEMAEKTKTLEDRVNLLAEKRREDQEDVKSSVTAYKEAVGELSMKIESVEHAMKDSLSPMLQTLRSLSDTLKAVKEK